MTPVPPADERGEELAKTAWATYVTGRDWGGAPWQFTTQVHKDAFKAALAVARDFYTKRERAENCAAVCNSCRRGIPVRFTTINRPIGFWVHDEPFIHDCGAERIRAKPLPASVTERGRGHVDTSDPGDKMEGYVCPQCGHRDTLRVKLVGGQWGCKRCWTPVLTNEQIVENLAKPFPTPTDPLAEPEEKGRLPKCGHGSFRVDGYGKITCNDCGKDLTDEG